MTAYLAKLVFFTLAYVGTALVSLKIQSNHDGITPIWPPAGIALFAFHYYGMRMWPVVALGIGFLGWHVGIPPVSAAIAAIGNIGEATIGCLLLRRFDIHLGQRFQDIVKFLFLPVLLSPLFAASLGATGMVIGGAGSWSELPVMWFMWWVGDACGILLLTPLLYGWWRCPKMWSSGSRIIEWLVVVTASTAIGWYTFYGRDVSALHGTGNLQILVMPFLLWAAIRLGLRGVTLVSLICCGWVLWGAANNTGPFEMDDKVTMGLFESSFILVITLTGLIVQALFRELAHNIKELSNAREHLEQRVVNRTADLEHSNTRLHQEIDARKLTQSELRESEQNLYRAKVSAEEANNSKTRFLAAASHDLRQPLQAILSHTDLLQVKNQDPELGESIRQIDRAGTAMRELLEKLLGASEIDAGRLSTNLTNFPIETVLEDLQEQFQTNASEKGLTLKHVACNASVHSDPALVRVILQNLVSNAIKYTNNGKVLLGCKRHGNRLRVCVVDTGIGINSDQQKNIFEEFYQLDNPARDRKQGTGFGLAIVQRVADLLNHPLSVQSIPGKGSCFAVDIPLSQEDNSTTAGSQGETAVNIDGDNKLLLIDDDEIVLHATSLSLKVHGYHVTAVASSKAAFDALAAGQPDIIVSDYRLPGSYTGIELVKELRRKACREIPVIILTGDITLSEDNTSLPDACQLLQKPVPTETLKLTINRLLENTT